MYEPNYPMEYTGQDGEMIYGDYVRILRELPHGHTLDNGHVLIGEWCEVEHYLDRSRFLAPRKWFRARKG